jgi:hypothetical protein
MSPRSTIGDLLLTQINAANKVEAGTFLSGTDSE